MDIIQLKYFLAVARTLNFTKAADELYVSHSTVSRAISALEKDFGVVLFERDNRSVTLTEAGAYLAEKADAIVCLSDELELAMKQFSQETTRTLRIATFNFFSNQVFRKIEKFRMDNPAVDISFTHCGQLSEIIDTVNSGKANVGLTFSFTLKDDSPFYVLPIQSGEFVLLVSTANPLASRTSIDIRDPSIETPLMINTIDYPFVTSVGKDASYHQKASKVRKIDSLNSFILQIKANLGIGIVPEHLATQVGQGCSIVSLDGVDSTYQLVLFYKRDNKDPLLQKLIAQF